MWDGRRDSAFSQVFSPIESPLELNSSRLFVAQRIAASYREVYEAVFGPLPATLADYAELAPEAAGCTELPPDPVHEGCPQPGIDDEDVTRVVANFGKAISAYTRRLTCGRSRFDAWMDGDETSLSAIEQRGAIVFVEAGQCDVCHGGAYLTDQAFHNLGVRGSVVPFTGIDTADDPGAAPAVALLRDDWLNSKGPFSDGYDGRLDDLPQDESTLLGAFRTPSLRCVGKRLSFMHNGELRSLEDVVDFFAEGGHTDGFVGESENWSRPLDEEDRDALVAFLRALDGPGPDAALLQPPPAP